jgi:hypothetical protein
MTNREFLKYLATVNVSGEPDDRQMQDLLRRLGFPQARVVCGTVYLEGQGEPVDIHYIAKSLLDVIAKVTA